MMRRFVSLLLALAGATAQAQGFPSKPVRLVVPFPLSGGNDAFGRLVAQGGGD